MDEFSDFSKEDVIKHFASLEFNRFLDYYENAPDLNVSAVSESRSEKGGKADRFGRTGYKSDFTRLFINLGSVDDFTRGDMLGYICNNAQISGKSIGKIDLKGVYTFFEVENDVVDKIMSGFQRADFNGRSVRVELAGDRDAGPSRSGSSRSGRSSRSSGRGGRDRERDSGNGGGFRDFSGKRRERKGERKKW
jgi:ATP-dependent RNA helicase DeaD